MQIKKTNKQIKKDGCKSMIIDVESIYNQMKASLAERAKYQKQMDDLWVQIKRTHCNKNAEMKQVVTKIGNCTHKLNQLISKLCNYKKTHRAMNLACDYIDKEISRINKIINKTENEIRDTNAGRKYLITATGHITTDTSMLVKYVAGKKEQVRKLSNWHKAMAKYRA